MGPKLWFFPHWGKSRGEFTGMLLKDVKKSNKNIQWDMIGHESISSQGGSSLKVTTCDYTGLGNKTENVTEPGSCLFPIWGKKGGLVKLQSSYSEISEKVARKQWIAIISYWRTEE